MYDTVRISAYFLVSDGVLKGSVGSVEPISRLKNGKFQIGLPH